MGTLGQPWQRKDNACPKVVTMYDKSMGGVDRAGMLITLYRI